MVLLNQMPDNLEKISQHWIDSSDNDYQTMQNRSSTILK